MSQGSPTEPTKCQCFIHQSRSRSQSPVAHSSVLQEAVPSVSCLLRGNAGNCHYLWPSKQQYRALSGLQHLRQCHLWFALNGGNSHFSRKLNYWLGLYRKLEGIIILRQKLQDKVACRTRSLQLPQPELSETIFIHAGQNVPHKIIENGRLI